MEKTTQIQKQSFYLSWGLIALASGIGIGISLLAHNSPQVLKVSGPLGALTSLIFGSIYGKKFPTSFKTAALGGAITGAACAFVGILTGFIWGDQPGFVIVAGTMGGLFAGLIGSSVTGKISGSF
jgi:hypothetical protein